MSYIVDDRPQLARDLQEYSDTDAIGVPIHPLLSVFPFSPPQLRLLAWAQP